jgi:methyltransferase (TIGR00027 family)
MEHPCSSVTEMEAGQPSCTSILVAALRAYGAREPDPSVRTPDWLARRLLGPEELRLISDHPVVRALEEDYQKGRQRMDVAGMSNVLLIRTRFIDDHLRRSLETGVTQVVVLGAGFDTRAYRFQELLEGKKFFEVDFRATQEIKIRRVREALGGVPPHVVFVDIDFKRDTLRDVIQRAGYQPTRRTCFIWEGVSMYLSEDAVRETLRTIASFSVHGSSLVMDFAGRATIVLLGGFRSTPSTSTRPIGVSPGPSACPIPASGSSFWNAAWNCRIPWPSSAPPPAGTWSARMERG